MRLPCPPSPNLDYYIGAIYQNLGETFQAMGKPQIAIAHLDSTLVYYHPKSESVGSIFGIMADCYSDLGDFTGAEQLLNRWKDHWAEHLEEGHHYHSRWYQSAGAFYVLVGDLDRGIEYLQTALNLNLTNYGGENPEVARSYIALGEAFLLKQDYAPAKSNFQYALVASRSNQSEEDCSNPEFIVASYQGIGNVYMERYFAEDNPINLTLALSNFHKALDVLKCHQSSYYSASSKARLSSRSYPALEQAIRAHRLLFERSGDQEHLEAAFALLEQSKSVLLFESLQEAEALQFAGIPDDLLQQENDLRIDLTFFDKKRKELKEAGIPDTDEQLTDISTQLLALQQRYESLKDQFEQEYPTYFSLKYDLETITLQELQSDFLEKDQTLLEYFVGDQFIYLFAVRNDAVELLEIPLDFDLTASIEQIRFGLYGYHSAANRTDQLLEETVYAYVAAGQDLYRHLILPVDDFIRGSLLIVPDGLLGYIPFETLLKYPPSDITNFSSYDYFFLDHPLSYNYSATLLQEMVLKEHFEEPTAHWLGFAPFFEGSYDYVETQAGFALENGNLTDAEGLSLRTVNFTQLPNSGDEMAVGSTLWDGTFFLGSDATRQQFFAVASQYRILHLSTHGVADPRVGDFSYLAFAKVEDGINNELLYVRDLYNLQLNADLVVLSACETGVGELQRGEGIISLARFAWGMTSQ